MKAKKTAKKKTARQSTTMTRDKREAELAKTRAEARKVEAEARKLEAEAGKAELDFNKAQRERLRESYNDDENFLYRFSKEVGHNSVEACMNKLTQWHRKDSKCDIEIVFSSPGGSIIDGFELFDFIQELRTTHKITTGSLGMAASMAGVLLQAGSHRWIGHQSWMMIHRAAFGAIGKTFEIEDEVKLVKRIEGRILDIFTSRSKLTKSRIKRNWDRKDWWIDADECLELGLVDEIKAMMPEHQLAEQKKDNKKKKGNTKLRRRRRR